MRILVTGGAGFIGSHVADAYLKAGHRVAVVDALVSGGGNRTPPGAGFYPVDIRSRDLADVFREERPEVVSHHAAQANLRRSLEDPAGDAEVNVLGTLRVLDLAVRHKARQFIFASTGGALYGATWPRPTCGCWDGRSPSRCTSPPVWRSPSTTWRPGWSR